MLYLTMFALAFGVLRWFRKRSRDRQDTVDPVTLGRLRAQDVEKVPEPTGKRRALNLESERKSTRLTRPWSEG